MDIEVYDSASQAAQRVADILIEKLSDNEKLVMGLATGRTMDAVYYDLVNKAKSLKINCKDARFFALDEYLGLDKNNQNSYAYYLNFHLYSPLGIPKEHCLIFDSMAEDFDSACREYEKAIKDARGIDIQLLGIGTNGHIALNEPGSALDSRSRVVALTSSTLRSNKSLFKESEIPLTALTMGIGTIMEAKECVLIATGESKANIIQKIVNGDINSHIPATALKAHKNFKLILDRDAAKLIK